MRADQIVVSPCSNPELELDAALAAYAALGYANFECFTSWARSAIDYHGDVAEYRALAEKHGMAYRSFHLPPISADRVDGGVEEAVRAARFAAELGVEVVLYKATDRPAYIQAAKAFLDAIEPLGITPVVQNHYGTAVSSLEDMLAVLEGIADPRMKALLEVGQFHSAGVSWRQGAEALGERIALVHIKDQIGRQSVPFGTGEIDLPGLFAHLDDRGYTGRFVVEMEVQDKENTLAYLASAREYVLRQGEE